MVEGLATNQTALVALGAQIVLVVAQSTSAAAAD